MALALLFLAPALNAQDRTPAEADRLYQQVGEQLFCICGCRENLLTCSHNVCSAKEEERKFLRELAGNGKFDESAIKQEMVNRFGPGVLQVPEQSSLYPLLAIAGAVLIAAFGAGFWVVTRKGERAEAPGREIDPELEARIADELKELD
ncbi:MAG: cytochrome c-type biogenesis protein CcmH [Planctomycetes bacterium]|nr:cytochrome c-type biogenesis protein CcmH [Planctomycetota bacterium]